MTWPEYATYITTTDGFFIGTNHPADARFTVENLTDLDDIVTYAKQYNGLMVWVKSENAVYSYYSSAWHRTPIIFGTATVGSVAIFDGSNWSLTFPTTGTIPSTSLDYATGAHVIYCVDEFPTNNVEYVCVGGISGARVWKATTS